MRVYKSISKVSVYSSHVLCNESVAVNLPDEQAIVLAAAYINVEYPPAQVALPSLVSKTL